MKEGEDTFARNVIITRRSLVNRMADEVKGILRKFLPHFALAIAGGFALAVAVPGAGGHPPLTITRFDDPTPDACLPTDCSLREAIILANEVPGHDIVRLPPGIYFQDLGHGDLANWYEDASYVGDLDITDDLTLAGSPSDPVVVTSTPGLPERAFDILPGVVAEFSWLAIDGLPGGGGPPLDCGRGIRNEGTATLDRVAITNNFMRGSGGGICNDGGTLTVRDTNITGNCACFFGSGGGIYSTGTVLLERVTLTGNRADAGDGGGIFSGVLETAALTMRDSVINDNETTAPFGYRRGGGVAAGGTTTAANLTISGNRTSPEQWNSPDVDSRGGGLYLYGTVTLTNVTVADNQTETSAGGLFFNGSGTLTITNTIIAGNTGGDCEGPITSAGHNIAGDSTCGLTGPGDMTGVDAMLTSLSDNGGPTQTHALLPGSPAIDAGDDAACPEADQRGAPRPVDGDGTGGVACDIGAYEAGSNVPTPAPPSPTATPPLPVIIGDADCGGTVNSVDSLWVLRFTASLEPYAECLFAANVNCNLSLGAVDALLILRYVAALPISQPPDCPKIGLPP